MRRIFKRLFGVASLSTLLFIFEACYGAPPSMGYDLLIEGKVVSKTTGNPLKDVKVSVFEAQAYQFTDENGNFSFYADSRNFDSIRLLFSKNTKNLDTTIAIKNDRLFVSVIMEE